MAEAFRIGQTVSKRNNLCAKHVLIRHDESDDAWLIERAEGPRSFERFWVESKLLIDYEEAVVERDRKAREDAETLASNQARLQALQACCSALEPLAGTPVSLSTYQGGDAMFRLSVKSLKEADALYAALTDLSKRSVNDMVASLMNHVQASMNQRQRLTTFSQQIAFLTTEVGEVQKELLKADGVYGAEAQVGAMERAAYELQDCLWNVLAAFVRIGAQPDFASHLKANAERVWPGDPLTEKPAGDET